MGLITPNDKRISPDCMHCSDKLGSYSHIEKPPDHTPAFVGVPSIPMRVHELLGISCQEPL